MLLERNPYSSYWFMNKRRETLWWNFLKFPDLAKIYIKHKAMNEIEGLKKILCLQIFNSQLAKGGNPCVGNYRLFT
jgi:hypothetical protein